MSDPIESNEILVSEEDYQTYMKTKEIPNISNFMVPARFPDEEAVDYEPDDLTELAVYVCEHCFDGLIRFPLQVEGKFQDQGIDLFYVNQPIRKAHRCKHTNLEKLPPGRDRDARLAFARLTQRRGKWTAKKLALPARVKEEILSQPWASPGPVTTESELR